MSIDQRARSSFGVLFVLSTACMVVLGSLDASARSKNISHETVLNQVNQPGVVATPMPDNLSSQSPTTSGTPSRLSIPTGSSGASEAANGAALQQMIGAGMSATTGAILLNMCPKCQACCPMGGMAIAQAGMMLANSGGAKKAAQGSSTIDYGGGYTYDPYGGSGTCSDGSCKSGDADPFKCVGAGCGPDGSCTGPNCKLVATDPNGNPNPNSPWNSVLNAYNRSKDDLAAKGIKLTPDGSVILPNGKKVSPADMSSAGAMAAAGYSDSEIAAGMAAAQAAGPQAQQRLKGLQALMSGEGGGGGGVNGTGAGSGGASGGGAGGMGKFGWDMNKKGRGTASVSGMSKKLGNDRIGVAGDNIFEMVKRRYKARDEAGHFIKD